MNTTQVPTEWLEELNRLAECRGKVSVDVKNIDAAFSLISLYKHIECAKYFQPQPDSVDLDVNLEEFTKWMSVQTHTDKIYYSMVDLEFKKYENDEWHDIPFSEVYKAFKKSKS